MRDSCLVFVPDGADSLLSVLKARFSETMQHGSAASVAYEFKYGRLALRVSVLALHGL